MTVRVALVTTTRSGTVTSGLRSAPKFPYIWDTGCMSETAPNPVPTGMPRDNRIALLDAEVSKAVRQGWQVQSRTDFQAILTKQKKIGLWLNLLLVIITGGLWLIYVIYRALNRKSDTRTITVDINGKVRG